MLVVVWHDLIISELLIWHYYIYILFYNFTACLYRHSNWMLPSYCVLIFLMFLEFIKIPRLKICNREQVSISFLLSLVPIVTMVTVYVNYCTWHNKCFWLIDWLIRALLLMIMLILCQNIRQFPFELVVFLQYPRSQYSVLG